MTGKRLIILLAGILAAVSCSSRKDVRDYAALIGDCAELGTVEYTCDLRFQNRPAMFEAIKPGPRIILYSAKVFIKAGIDLTDRTSIKVEPSADGKTATVTLPSPRILAYKIEPKDVNKEFEKIGLFRWKFTNEEKLSIRQRAEEELKEQVYGPNPRIPILQDARKNARAEVELLLMATGRFESVTVNFSGDEKVR